MRVWVYDEDRPPPGENWCRVCGVHLHLLTPLNFKFEDGESNVRLYEFIVTCPCCDPDEYEYRKAF